MARHDLAQQVMAALAAGPAGTVTTAGAGGPGAHQVTDRSRRPPGQQAQSSGTLPRTVVALRIRVFTLRMPPP
jgi:hypothetical protein